MLYFKPKAKAIFVGKEKEGSAKGTDTLFIVGEPAAENILECLDYNQVSRIYFGAGFLAPVSLTYLIKTFRELNSYLNHKGTQGVKIAIEAKFKDWDNFINLVGCSELILTLESEGVKLLGSYETIVAETLKEIKAHRNSHQVFIKTDFNKTVLVTPISQLVVSSYYEFNSADTVLFSE
jgi:hypothetical protein